MKINLLGEVCASALVGCQREWHRQKLIKTVGGWMHSSANVTDTQQHSQPMNYETPFYTIAVG